MVSKFSFGMFIFLILFIGLPVMAQSASDLSDKYGRPNIQWVRRVGYQVRPDIILTASFASDGQMCEAVIEPKRVTVSGIDAEKRMSIALASELIDELAPRAQLGPSKGGITWGNYTSISWTEYEKVNVSRVLVGVGGAEKDLKVDEIRINWKDRRCQ